MGGSHSLHDRNGLRCRTWSDLAASSTEAEHLGEAPLVALSHCSWCWRLCLRRVLRPLCSSDHPLRLSGLLL